MTYYTLHLAFFQKTGAALKLNAACNCQMNGIKGEGRIDSGVQ